MSYRRIAIGVDFGTASLAAVRWVASAFGRRARMLLVHVAREPRMPAFLTERLPSEADTLSAASTVYQGLRGLADLAGPGGSEVDIRAGVPADGLALAAEEFGAHLICVGKSRSRRGSGRFGATTPQRVLSRTKLPVLVVPESARGQPTSVLAAVNDQSDGHRVLHAASRLALAWDARLDALHAVDPELLAFVRESTRGASWQSEVQRGAPPLAAATIDALSDVRLCLLAREWVAQQVAGLTMREGRVVPIARFGEAGEALIAHAMRSDTGLIVLGRCGHDDSRPGGAALGSTTRLTMWVAPCPVLVLGSPAARPERDTTRATRHQRVSRRETPALALTSGGATIGRHPSLRPFSDGGDAA